MPKLKNGIYHADVLESNLGNPHPQYFAAAGGIINGKVEIRRPTSAASNAQAWFEVNGLDAAALSLYRISALGVGRAVALGVIHFVDNPDLCVVNEGVTAYRGLRASLYRIGDTIVINSNGQWVDVTKLPQIPAAKITPGNAPIGHILMVVGENTAAFSAPPDTSGGTAGVSSLNGKTGVVSLAAGTNVSITAEGNVTKLPQIPAAKITPGNAPIGHILMVVGENTAAFSAPPDTSGGTAGVFFES